MKTIIEVQGLCRLFGSVRALENLTFSVEEGEVFGMLGPNGAGKTTTVRLLNGVLEPSAGKIRVMGLDPLVKGSQVRRQTGVLTETPSLYERLTARDNLLTFGAFYSVPQARLEKRVAELLDEFGLAERANDRVGGFSKGMKQRLALARALLHEPPLLFLDEPTSGLDPEASQQVTSLIKSLSQEKGRTIFLCTHNLQEAESLCDRVAVMNRGQLLALGTVSELASNLWPGQWVDIQLLNAPTPDLVDSLRLAPGMKDVQVDSEQLALQVDQPGRIADVIAFLVGQGVRILSVIPRRRNLEDIYFTLQAKEHQRLEEF